VVVVLLDRELDLGTRVGVTQTKLRAAQITRLKRLQQLVAVQPQATEQILHNLVRFAVDARESGLDGTSQVLVGNTEDNLLLLAALGEVQFQKGQEVGVGNTLGDVICVLERLGSTPKILPSALARTIDIAPGVDIRERRKGHQLDHLPELGEVRGGLLDFLQTVANGVRLLDDLVQAVADGGLLEDIIDSGHCGGRWRLGGGAGG
jgi:hypothetical protein